MDTPRAESVIWDPPLPEASGFEHRMVHTPGLRTHVATVGEGAPVILLHGFPQHWWQWRAVAPTIARAGYRVICPDLRGAGWTEADDSSIGRETRLGDLLALMDVLDVPRADIVAHDMGAITAIQLAYAHPGRVRSLVQLSVPPVFLPFSPKLLPGFRHMPKFIWHRAGRPIDETFAPPYSAHPMPADVVAAHLAPMARPEVDAAVRPLFRRMVIPVSMQIARGTFAREHLRPPTRAVFGRLDRPWDEALLRRLCGDTVRHADRFEFAFIDDASHFISDDAPDEVAALTLGWFERVA